MSNSVPRGLLVFGRDAQRRANAVAVARDSGRYAPVRVASQLAEAAKCFADTAVQVVVVVDQSAAAAALQEFVAGIERSVLVVHCATDDDVKQVLHQ